MKKKEPELMMSLQSIFFSAGDPRRRQEKKDSRMISEDHQALANLSPKPINKQFNANKYAERFANPFSEISGDEYGG